MSSNENFDRNVRLEHYKSGIVAVREVGVFALKTLITLNSGAFVVLLTFIGNAAAQSLYLVPLWNIQFELFAFLAGIALSFIVIAYTYVSSQGISPYPKSAKRTDGWFVPIAVGVSAIAFLCFLAGVIVVALGVSLSP